MVLELDDVQRLKSSLVGQLVHLHHRLSSEGGVLRLCGLSDENQKVLRACHLDMQFPPYQDRREAIMAPRTLCAPHSN